MTKSMKMAFRISETDDENILTYGPIETIEEQENFPLEYRLEKIKQTEGNTGD